MNEGRVDHLDLESLSAYLDGELDSRERSEVEAHLRSCPDCSDARAKLAMAAGRVATLPALEMTVDEHRELRQAVLKARPVRSSWAKRYLQWALAGGLVMVAVAAIGLAFLRSGSSGDGDSALTEAAAPATERPAFNFSSGTEVDRTVASLPEVAAGVNRYRTEDAQAAQGSTSLKAEAFAGSSPGSFQDGAGQPTGRAMPPAGRAAEPGNTEDEGSQDTDGAAAATGEAAPFTNEAADACLERVARTQSYPMVPLLARQATFRGTQAWLLVFAWTPEPEIGKTLDRWQTWLVTPEDCRNSEGAELESVALYRSFSEQT